LGSKYHYYIISITLIHLTIEIFTI